MTTCHEAAERIKNGKNATSLIERLPLQPAIDHATNCRCEICEPALTQFYGMGLSPTLANEAT